VVSINSLLNIENLLCLLSRGIDLLDFRLPGRQVVILSRLQGLLEVVSNLFQLLALMKIFPVRTENVLNSSHVDAESSFDLLRPNDLVGYIGEASDQGREGHRDSERQAPEQSESGAAPVNYAKSNQRLPRYIQQDHLDEVNRTKTRHLHEKS
jgi:hypothetical protein